MVVQESSSSSSSSGSSYESETNSEPEPEAAASKLELTISPLTEIPPSVKNILEKIDAAQLDRARKEVFKQLFVILDNVNRVCDRFKGDEGMDPEIEEQFFLSGTWAERKRRALLLDKVAILLKASTAQGKDLKFVLESLKEWGEMLSEGKEQVGDTPTVQWVSDMETKLLTSLDYTEGCIMQLIELCTPLVEHRRKKRGKSIVPKTGMWRAWREKVAQKPQEAQPLSPEQMLEDESITFSRTSELLTMLQEFVGSTLFNKAEVVVVKYIVTMVANLTKAFTLLTKQSHGLQAKYDTLVSQESKKQEVQYVNLQKEVQVLNEKKASLEARVQSTEHKYKMLFLANEAMQKELHKVKEKAVVKTEPSLRDMKFGVRASYERKSQEDDKHLSREKDANLSAEKSQADLAKSPSGKREAKVPDKKQLQRPLVEKTEDTSDKQDTKLLDKKPALKASIERGEGTSDKQDAKLLDKKPALKASTERGEGISDKQDIKLLDKKPALKVSTERGEDTSDKQKAQKAPVERTQDTVVKWDAVIPVEKQEGTSGALAERWHEQPLDSEQTEAADKRDVNLLGGTQEVVEDVTGEWHELKADSEEDTERLPSPTELPCQGVSRKGKQRRKKESLYTEETHTQISQSPVSGSMLDPSTALCGFNSAILAYLEQKMEKLWKCPSPGQRQAERMLPKDPEAQRQTLMSRLEAARAVNNGAEVRNLYTYVERVDAYRKKVLQCWVAKQKTAEQTRRHCLGKMISLFAQLRLSSELHLNSPSPLVIKAVDEMKEFPSSAHARSKSPGYPSPLASVKKVRDFMHPAGVSEQVCDQIESVWRTDVISHSFPIVPKPHVSLLWSQAGFPDIPRFLELDVSSVRSKPLKSLQTR
ncbi:protein FAM186B [Terrapene carolina triunguis]|uniref:protein FAM186B n=1 Tax=Terrapene triunguis TaxID=2587831 RepID=UPI000E77699A|nr:protein FAM186B [Terrapene carolina triunguis]